MAKRRKYKIEFNVYNKDLKKYPIRELDVSETTDFGKIDSSLIEKSKSGDIIQVRDNELKLIKANFRDKYNLMKKGAQSIKLKDCGAILAETMVGKDSICLDCGAGMGGLSNFLARYVKKVYSCDIRKEHLENAQFNSELLGLKNIEFVECNITKEIPIKKKFDLITLDMPNPDEAIEVCKEKLKDGAYLVAYCPQAIQMHKFILKAKENGFDVVKSMGVIQRSWKVEERILRPEHVGLQHTAFLIFTRKIW